MPGRRKDEAHRWFQQASYDLKAVEWNLQGGFYDTACFLAQQAAEKALKSLLYYLGARRTAQKNAKTPSESLRVVNFEHSDKNRLFF